MRTNPKLRPFVKSLAASASSQPNNKRLSDQADNRQGITDWLQGIREYPLDTDFRNRDIYE